MKKIMGIVAIIALGTVLTACDDRRVKHKGKNHKGNDIYRVNSGHGPKAPNCAADGPGCRQFNPHK